MRILVFLFVLFFIIGCGSGIYMVESEVQDSYLCDTKKYNVDSFNFYVFNICERYNKEIDRNNRYCECPDNFFEVAKDSSIMKVEEVYFMVNESKNIVLYFTTLSHKYIRKNQTGFLNDKRIYKNKMVLEQIENIYVGRINTDNNSIVFNGSGKDKSIALHYNSEKFPGSILIESANIPTVERDFDNMEKVSLDEVFSGELEFKKTCLEIAYFQDVTYLNRLGESTIPISPIIIKTVHFKKENNLLSIIFQPKNPKKDLYKFSSKRIPYHPFFFDINE